MWNSNESIFSSVTHDLLYALRVLRRNPRFCVLSILTLGLGVGAATAIFSIFYAVLLRPLPYDHPDQLVSVWSYETHTANVPASGPDFADWRAQNRVFTNMVAYSNYRDFDFGHGSQPEHVRGAVVSPDFFRLLGIAPSAGRDFAADDEATTHSRVAIVSHRFWKSHFGTRSVVAESITLDANTFSIVGVLPSDFWFPHMEDVDIWVPLNSDPANLGEGASIERRDSHWLKVVARLRPEVTLAQAGEDMRRIALGLESSYPQTNAGVGISVSSLRHEATGTAGSLLWLLQGAAGLLFLVACLNVAGLWLARAIERQREIATRLALGAGLPRIARQLFMETLVLCIFGAGTGILIAGVVLRCFRVLQATTMSIAAQGSAAIIGRGGFDLSRSNHAGIDVQVLVFVSFAVFLSAVISSLAPLLMFSHIRSLEALRDGARVSARPWIRKFRAALVAAEVAMATVLLIGATLLTQSLAHLRAASPGFVSQGVLAARVQLTGARYATEQPRLAFYDQFLGRLRSFPTVTSAGIIDFLPFAGLHNNAPFLVKGRAEANFWKGPLAEYRIVSAGYFRTMQIPILVGRDFNAQDNENRPHTVIVSRNIADEFLGGVKEAPGQLLQLAFAPDDKFEVIGVVGDAKHWNVGEQPSRYVYFPVTQWQAGSIFIVVRSSGAAPEALAPLLHSQLTNVDSTLSIFDVKSMDQRRKESFGFYEMNLFTVGVFAGAALTLACVGIYGIISFIVAQRTPELATRMALGAQPRQVMSLVVKQCVTLTAVGLLMGTLAGLAASRILNPFLFGLRWHDPAAFIFAAAAILILAIASGYLPAHRATKINPAVTLRLD